MALVRDLDVDGELGDALELGEIDHVDDVTVGGVPVAVPPATACTFTKPQKARPANTCSIRNMMVLNGWSLLSGPSAPVTPPDVGRL